MNQNNLEEKENTNFFSKIISFFSQHNKKSEKKEKESWNKLLVARVIKKRNIPSLKQLKKLPKILTVSEKKIIAISIFLVALNIGFLGVKFFIDNSKRVPANGGEYIEGLIGEPQFINPVLAPSYEVDSDITRLIYSGLLKFNEKMELETDLAISYEVSDDGKEYTFYLNENVLWHDGIKFTANDVVFTVNTIKNPEYMSPLRKNFLGVNIEIIDDYSVKFILKEPYSPFINSLTFGILPQHQWGDIAPKNFPLSKLNLNPVGTGPFRADTFKRDDLGIVKSYTVTRNNTYYGKIAFLDKITFKFFPNIESAIDAINNNSILGLSILPNEYKDYINNEKDYNFYSLLLPEYTALFFNLKSNEFLKSKTIRNALALAIDRNELVKTVFDEKAKPVSGPILPGFIGYDATIASTTFNLEDANKILDENKWERITPEDYFTIIKENEKALLNAAVATKELENNTANTIPPEQETIISEDKENNTTETEPPQMDPIAEQEIKDAELMKQLQQQDFYRKKDKTILELNITTIDYPENIAIANMVKKYWENIGIRVDLFTLDITKINSEVIRSRQFDVLLYAEVVGSDPDPYPYWHSSQIDDPGLNITSFSHKKADQLMEDARATSKREKREEYYVEFQKIINEEIPTIFLYYPTYSYLVSNKVKNVNTEIINLPPDRFSDIEQRYMKTKYTVDFSNLKFYWK